jgi:hypothetical protein
MTTTIQYQRVDVKNLTDKHVKHKLSLIKPLVFEGHSFVAGGVFKTIFAAGEDFCPKDIDVFFGSSKDHTDMLDKFTKLSNLENPPYVYSHANANTISYTNVETEVNVDLIMREYGTPEHILSGFDFTCVKCAAVVENGEYRLVYHPHFLEHVDRKVLNYDSRREFDADNVFNRIIKYAQYGYSPSLELKTKLFNHIKSLQNGTRLSDPKVTKY